MDASKTKYLRGVVRAFKLGTFNPLDVRFHGMKAGLSERASTLFAVRLSRLEDKGHGSNVRSQQGQCAPQEQRCS